MKMYYEGLSSEENEVGDRTCGPNYAKAFAPPAAVFASPTVLKEQYRLA